MVSIGNQNFTITQSGTGGGGTGGVPTLAVAGNLYTLTLTNSGGFQNITRAQLLLGPANGQNACQVWFDPASSLIRLGNDAGTAFLGPVAVGAGGRIAGSPTTLSNAQCTLDVSQVIATSTGNTLTLTLPLTLAANFPAPGSSILAEQSNNGVSAGFVTVGTVSATGGGR
jgi:hypothetical protein